MALEDLIVQTGGNVARQATEGWNRGQEIARQKQEHQMNMQVRDAMLKKTNMDMEKLQSDQDYEKYVRNVDTFSQLVDGGAGVLESQPNVKAGVNQLRAYLQQNKQKLLDVGTDEDDKGLEELLKMPDDQFLSSYKAMHSSLPLVRDYARKKSLQRFGSTGGSEFERLSAIPEDQRTPEQKNRLKMLAGLAARPSQRKEVNGYWHEWDAETGTYINTGERTGSQKRADDALADKQGARLEKGEADLSKQAADDIGQYSSIGDHIEKAIAAIDLGDTRVLDQFMQQTLSQTNDTNIRAVQMYKEFGENYGNVLERMYRSVGGYLKGSRTAGEAEDLKKDLLAFKEKYAEPTAKKFRDRYRAMAADKKYDPFKVVPPADKFEIKNADIPMERKIQLLKIYFPDEFKKGSK